jgi:hypothetical protein
MPNSKFLGSVSKLHNLDSSLKTMLVHSRKRGSLYFEVNSHPDTFRKKGHRFHSH